MKHVVRTVIMLENAADVKSYLQSLGVRGPSLHPNVRSENTRDRWNGWNYTMAAGVDADGTPIMIEAWHFAAGGTDFSGKRSSGTGRLGSHAFKDFVWPIQVFPAQAIIEHPEHTPGEKEKT